MPSTTLETLRHAPLVELERLYAHDEPFALPGGRCRGFTLLAADSAGTRRLENRPMLWPGFTLPRFGVDFRRRAWWFHHPRIRVGAFQPSPGSARWRDTDTVQLLYHFSRLPWPIKGLLYDEVSS